MGFFDKKYCDICGSKIGLLGNRKLNDGNLCKDCAAKLSPFFSERRQSTVDEIREQLEYRERNQDEVAAFHTTRTFGTYTKILLDENRGKLMVTSSTNLEKANPDVMDFSQITGCRLDINESKDEMKCKDSEGNSHSYNPPQYRYSYDFYVVLDVNSPYFNEIRVKLNTTDITIEPQITLAAPMPMRGPGMPVGPAHGHAHHQDRPASSPWASAPQKNSASHGKVGGAGQERLGRPQGKPEMPSQGRPGMPPQGRPGMPPQPRLNNQVLSSYMTEPINHTEYRRFLQMGEEIKQAIFGVQQNGFSQYGAEPVQAVTCPWCGATTMPTKNGCCEYCDGALNA